MNRNESKTEFSETDSSGDNTNLNNSTKCNNQERSNDRSKLNVENSNQNNIPTETQNNCTTTSGNECPTKCFFVILTAIIAAICALKYGSIVQNEQICIDGLKQIFPNQPNETFENFEAVIDDILSTKEIHPAVFLFLYDSNESKVNKLVHHLAKYASLKLQTNTDYIDVHRDEFHTSEALNDYGYLLDKYKLDLLNKKVMLVKNIQNIPAHVAQVFHSFCDEISPLVEKVVYIFTLKVDSMTGKEEKIAESNLKRLWNNLDNDILMPLITRVTSTVLKVSK